MIRAWSFCEGIAGGKEVAGDALAAARAGAGTLLIVDVAAPTPEELTSLAAQLPIHPLVVDDLRNSNQRTKLEHLVDQFHVAVHACEVHDDRLAVKEVDVVFGPDWLLAVRQPVEHGQPPMALEEVMQRFERSRLEPGPDDLGCALWALLDVVVDGYFTVTDRVDDRLDDIEEIVFGDEHRDAVPQEVFSLRRGVVRFRRASAPLREVLGELLRHEVEWLGPETLVRLQDVYDHSLRIADLVDSQRDLLTGLLEAHLAIVSNRMNDVMKRTSSWGALILVPSLIAGIYGMNFKNMFLQDVRWGYPAMMLGTFLVTLALYRFFRRRGWV